MPEISAELIAGPYAGNTGRLSFRDEPPRTLAFNLGDSDGSSGIIIPTSSSVSDKLTAVYVRIEEKPRKVLTYDDNGRAHSEKGVRYRYDRELSPVEALLQQADDDARVEAFAREQIEQTRKLLLADSWEQARKAKRDVERVGDLVEAHAGRLVSISGGKPQRFTGMRRDFTRDGGVVVTLDGVDVPCLVDDEVLLLDERDTR
jgi:hypothetical protein